MGRSVGRLIGLWIAASLVVAASLLSASTWAREGPRAAAYGHAHPFTASKHPLWEDPQFFPHPAYGWPTLTNPPKNPPIWWRPVDPLPATDIVAGLVASGPTATSTSAGDGMAVFGRILVTPGYPFSSPTATPAMIFDISDPGHPQHLANYTYDGPEAFAARDAAILAYPDGRLVVALTSDQGNVAVVDITDPARPKTLSFFRLPSGGHSISFVPGTPILYNANTVGPHGIPLPHLFFGRVPKVQTDIFDLSDPAQPVLVQEWQNGAGCHMIDFYIDPAREKYRAYCAALSVVQIWDINDPKQPFIVSTFNFTHPDQLARPDFAFVAHSTVVNRDGTVLAVSDEQTGGLGPPGCTFHREVAGRTVTGPNGNLWFYDVRDERHPKLLGSLSANLAYVDNHPPYVLTPWGSCTGHLGHAVPHPTRDLAVVSFYAAGVLLVDFTDPRKPFAVDQAFLARPPEDPLHGTIALDVWYYQGRVLVGLDNGIAELAFR